MFDGGEDALVRGHRPGARGNRALNAFMARIVTMMAEMEQGQRPAGSLDAIASPLAARRIRHLVHDAQTEARSGGGRRRRRTSPTTVLSAHSFHPTAGVAEGVVVLTCEKRSRAYCIRLEQEGGRWRLVELATPGGRLRPAVTEASRSGAVPLDEHGQRRSSGRGGVSYSAAGWRQFEDETSAARETRAKMRAANRRSHVRGTGDGPRRPGRGDGPRGIAPDRDTGV